ncbi:helix-turn-helix transcriptional regulator [Maritalea sp.]|jgi:transcriptional regulator with XRE-family HTH domain|uniref:helix-turn-helix transcriptional regulator n=1 Tax=Maritalea sp. TaxID=2003361 RepID=UPI0039E3A883
MLSEALRLIRVFHDLKQNELAERLDISQSFLSEIENGKKAPSNELVAKYATEFDLPISSIWFFDENLIAGTSKKNLDKAQGIIADKILDFLRMVERGKKAV